MKRSVFPYLLVISAFWTHSATAQLAGYYPKGGPDVDAQQVSLIQLIATPERYDGKTIRLIGYLHLEFEGDAIYFHRDDFADGIAENAIWINLPKDIKPEQIKSINDHYVICTAKFAAGRHGHMGMFAGELENITRLEVWDIAPDGKGMPPVALPQKPAK